MTIVENKQANQNYQISETFEAGLVLSGPEVKAAKKGSVDFKGSYVKVDQDNQAWLVGTYIAPYQPAKTAQKKYNPHQDRKLLLTKKEIRFLIGKQKEKRITIAPLKLYVKNNWVKLQIGIGMGKKKYDKREDIKKRDFDRRKRQKFGI